MYLQFLKIYSYQQQYVHWPMLVVSLYNELWKLNMPQQNYPLMVASNIYEVQRIPDADFQLEQISFTFQKEKMDKT